MSGEKGAWGSVDRNEKWEMPVGTHYLSPSYEVATRALMGRSPYIRFASWTNAIKELRALPNGEEAYQGVLQEFREKNHRAPGDTRALSKQGAAEDPNWETWRWTYDDHAEAYAQDFSQIATTLATKFDGKNNPRTSEFVRRVSQEYQVHGRKASESYDDGVFEETLTFDPRIGSGPSEMDNERQGQEFAETWGKHWDEMDENDFYENPQAAVLALRHFPGHVEAIRIANREWDKMQTILRQVRPWHSFYSDQEEYITRRANQLLGSRLDIAPYQHADQAFNKLTADTLLSMDCEALLDFADFYRIPNGRQRALEVMRDALEAYCDDGEGTVRKQMETEGYDFYQDPERYVRKFNSILKYPQYPLLLQKESVA